MCEIMLHLTVGNFSCSIVLYRQEHGIRCEPRWRTRHTFRHTVHAQDWGAVCFPVRRVSTFASRKCLRHYTQRRHWGRGGRERSLATKGQSKLLSGSHDNRGETDKGLPRKATFRLRRKTLQFNPTRLSLAASPMITGR